MGEQPIGSNVVQETVMKLNSKSNPFRPGSTFWLLSLLTLLAVGCDDSSLTADISDSLDVGDTSSAGDTDVDDTMNTDAANDGTNAGDATNGDATNGDAANDGTNAGDATNGDATNDDVTNGDATNGDTMDVADLTEVADTELADMDVADTDVADTDAPFVMTTAPLDADINVALNRSVRVTFSEGMNPNTLTDLTFTVIGPGAIVVEGTVSSSGAQAVFTPLFELAPDTLFEATITTGAEDLAGIALESDYLWSFTTGAETFLGPDPVPLGLAGDYVILAKSGIDTVPSSAIVGNIGVSPIDSTAVTGFSLTLDSTTQFATSSQITGQVFAPDYAVPTPSNLTTAIGNMETAYTDAAGRSIPDFTELGAGEIGGLTLVPGLYKWGTGVSISTSMVLDGGPDDVWIFQIAGDVTQANGTLITLSGGALPKNIFWQAFGQVMIGTTAHFEGIVLCQTAIVLGTGASVNGRLLAQTAVTLDQNAVTQPAL